MTQTLFKERAKRLDDLTKLMPIQENHSLIRVGRVPEKSRNSIREAANIFLWTCLNEIGVSVKLSNDMLRDYEEEIKSLPNITPNGLVLPKFENILAFNMLHKEVSEAFKQLEMHDYIDRIQYPINLRLQSGVINPEIDNRPRSSTKIHSDIWAGDPASGIITFLAVSGNVENAGIRFLEPKSFPGEFVRTFDDFNDAKEMTQDAKELCWFNDNGWFIVDPYLLHQTRKSGHGVRLSIDFRFIPKQQLPSDTFEDETRRPYFIPFDQWYEIGRSIMLTTDESINEFKKKSQPYTIGYTVPINMVKISGNEAVKVDPSSQALKESITPKDVAKLFGVDENAIKKIVPEELWRALKFRYVSANEEKKIIAGIEDRISGDKLRVVGKNDNSIWENGWGEILKRIQKADFDPEILRPQYFDHHQILRYNGRYIDTGGVSFVYAYDKLLRHIIFSLYLKDAERIVEIGCGTGTSQLLLASIYPKAELVACDWAESSQQIIEHISRYLKRPIKPARFNMLTLEGEEKVVIDRNTTLLTVHALEQLGNNTKAMLDWIMKNKPKLCVHLEPIVELYGETPFDDIAKRYHMKRNYLQGWLSEIRKYEEHKKSRVHIVNRLNFGDRYHEAYSIIVWEPL